MNQNITLTLGAFSVPETVHGVLKDTGRNLVIKLSDYTLQAGDSAVLYIHRPDDVRAEEDGTINTTAQTVTVELDNALQVVGPNGCTLTITNDGDTISSYEFEVACHPSAQYEGSGGGGDNVVTITIHYNISGYEESFKVVVPEGYVMWFDFITSEYNPIIDPEIGRMFVIGPEGVELGEGSSKYLTLNGEYINGDDTMIDGATYDVEA